MKIRYSTNNSGGNYWLSEKNWYELQRAGWEILELTKDEYGYGRTLCHEAFLDCSSVEEAKASFQQATGLNPTTRGCSCCGMPHQFTEEDEKEAPTQEYLATLTLGQIALVIRSDWKPKVYFGAVPYLQALQTLTSIKDPYMYDSGESIVAYFLANANTWRGPTARAVKKHLNKLLKDCR